MDNSDTLEERVLGKTGPVPVNRVGILDPEGNQLNPLNNKPYSDTYKEYGKIWSKFPAYKKHREIIEAIQKNQILLVIAETGSGKTVLVPKFALHAYDYKAKIAITLPKQLTAKSAAQFAAITLDVQLGDEVGYQYRGSPKEAKSQNTKLLYATDGTIVARLNNDPRLEDFDMVIIDEAHERKVQIDFLIYLLRETLKLRPDFKIIIMSATINSKIFESYFKDYKYKEIHLKGERNHPIESIFLDKIIKYEQALTTGFDILKDILKNDDLKINPKGAHDIIFFITSSSEAFDLCRKIAELPNSDSLFCVEVYSGMDSEKQTLAQEKDDYKKLGKSRKIIIATNVAESSLTFDGIKYVIDTGYELKSSYDPEKRAKKLDRKMITNAQAKQRMGRTGRTEPGICYHLYTKDDFENKMEKYPEPDIRTSDISLECLRLLQSSKIETVPKLIETLTKFIEPPKESYIRAAITELIKLNTLSDNSINKLGTIASQLNLSSLSMNVTLIYSYIYDCSHEMIKIISMIEASKQNLGEIFITPSFIIKSKERTVEEKRKMENWLNEKYKKAKNKFKHKYGDHLSLLKIYDKFEKYYQKYYQKDRKKVFDWTHDNFLKLDTLLRAKDMIPNIKRSFYGIKKDIDQNIDTLDYTDEVKKIIVDDRLLFSLLVGFFINRAKKIESKDQYKTLYSDDPIRLDKDSFLNLNKTLPKNVIYNELSIILGNANLGIVSKMTNDIAKYYN